MYIARILYPVNVLGPGNRIGIWFAGCPRRCRGCISPELWEFREKYQTNVSNIVTMIGKIVKEHPVDGFTVSGGDPLYQPEEFLELSEYLKAISEDILVYTGYRMEEIDGKYLKNVGVLIDGPYMEEQNTGCFLRGSENQRMIFLKKDLQEKYEEYRRNGGNRLQNFTAGGHVVTVGIPNNG